MCTCVVCLCGVYVVYACMRVCGVCMSQYMSGGKFTRQIFAMENSQNPTYLQLLHYTVLIVDNFTLIFH